MTKKLLDSAEYFYRVANNNMDLYLNGVKNGIQSELNVANKSVEKLLATYGSTKHPSLIELQLAFDKLGRLVNRLTWQDAAAMLPEFRSAIGGATFYTATINTGTGFDPITKQLGSQSPAACLGRISAHVQRLDGLVRQYGNRITTNR
jgi:hypothetical protein